MTRPGSALAGQLLDPGIWETNPYPLLAQLRAKAPVAWNEERGFWAISRHADVIAIESDSATFCASRGILIDEIGTTFSGAPPTIMHTDPPQHTRYRRLVQPAFKGSAIKLLEPAIKAKVDNLVRGIPADTPIDVVSSLAVPLPIAVITELLGLGPAEEGKVQEWSDAVIPGATDWPAERRQQLMGEMIDSLLASAARRRGSPSGDVLSILATAEVDGDRLSDAELTMFLVQLLVAGNETTRQLIAGGLVALADSPGEWARWRSDRSLVQSAIEELLRWTTPVVSFLRTATRPCELAGQHIAENEPVLMLFASANRDEAVFGTSANLLDIGRTPNPHLAFGFGNHFCLGAALARLEARLVLDALVDRFSAVSRVGRVERSGSCVIAGFRKAELLFSKID